MTHFVCSDDAQLACGHDKRATVQLPTEPRRVGAAACAQLSGTSLKSASGTVEEAVCVNRALNALSLQEEPKCCV